MTELNRLPIFLPFNRPTAPAGPSVDHPPGNPTDPGLAPAGGPIPPPASQTLDVAFMVIVMGMRVFWCDSRARLLSLDPYIHNFASLDSRSRSLCMAVRPASTASVRTVRLSLMKSRPLSSARSTTSPALSASS